MIIAFREWLLKQEFVNPAAAPEPMDMEAMIRKAGGGAMLSGEAQPHPWDGPGGIVTPTPRTSMNNAWNGAKRQIARRLRPITPTGKMIAKRP